MGNSVVGHGGKYEPDVPVPVCPKPMELFDSG